MREARTYEETLVDRVALLTLWHQAARDPLEDAGDKLRQMKLAFLASHDLFSRRAKGMDLAFYRWTWGPMSNQIYEDWEALTRAGLVENEERFVFTRAGQDLAHDFANDVLAEEQNALFRSTIAAVAERWVDEPSTTAILNHVYAMEVSPVYQPSGQAAQTAQPIRAIPRGTQLTAIWDASEATDFLQVEPGWLETLALTFSPAARTSIGRAERDFRELRWHVA